jgi:hypothetical protein
MECKIHFIRTEWYADFSFLPRSELVIYVIPETVMLTEEMFSMSIQPASHFPLDLLYKYYRQEYHLILTAVLPVNG